jgi:hypothetical protein
MPPINNGTKIAKNRKKIFGPRENHHRKITQNGQDKSNKNNALHITPFDRIGSFNVDKRNTPDVIAA